MVCGFPFYIVSFFVCIFIAEGKGGERGGEEVQGGDPSRRGERALSMKSSLLLLLKPLFCLTVRINMNINQ